MNEKIYNLSIHIKIIKNEQLKRYSFEQIAFYQMQRR